MGRYEDWGLPGPTYDMEKMADMLMEHDDTIRDFKQRLRLLEAHLGFQKYEPEDLDGLR